MPGLRGLVRRDCVQPCGPRCKAPKQTRGKQSKTTDAISPLNGGKALLQSMHQCCHSPLLQSTPLTAVDWGNSIATEHATEHNIGTVAQHCYRACVCAVTRLATGRALAGSQTLFITFRAHQCKTKRLRSTLHAHLRRISNNLPMGLSPWALDH